MKQKYSYYSMSQPWRQDKIYDSEGKLLSNPRHVMKKSWMIKQLLPQRFSMPYGIGATGEMRHATWWMWFGKCFWITDIFLYSEEKKNERT